MLHSLSSWSLVELTLSLHGFIEPINQKKPTDRQLFTFMNKIKFLLLNFLLFGAVYISSAQVIINEPATVGLMLNRYTELNERTTRIRGYRILIHSTRDRNQMEKVLRDFQFSYPNINVDWKHDRPDYKIRAGAFESKLEAQRLLNVIRRDYPEALVMTDYNMNPRELVE